MLLVNSLVVLGIAVIVFVPPVVRAKHVVHDNEVYSDVEKEALRSKKSLPGTDESKIMSNVKNNDFMFKTDDKLVKNNEEFIMLEDRLETNENLREKTLKYEGSGNNLNKLNFTDTLNIDLYKNTSDQDINDINAMVDNREKDYLFRATRQFMSMYPRVELNGLVNPLTPVQMDSRFGPLNDAGLNYVQINPDQVNNYIRQGLTIKEDLDKKNYGHEAEGQSKHPGYTAQAPVYHYAVPQHQQHQQPMVVIQPIVIPAPHEDSKCPILTLPVIKDKHPHIELVKPISKPAISTPTPTPISNILNSPLIPSLLTTILPALIPLLTKKKKEEPKKNVIYMSKQFLINPNVVPSISVPAIGSHLHPHPKTDLPEEKPSLKEVETFLDNVVENKTLSREYFKNEVKNEEMRLANLQAGEGDHIVGEAKASIPIEYQGKLMKRVAELDAAVGMMTERLEQLQNQQRLAHSIAASLV